MGAGLLLKLGGYGIIRILFFFKITYFIKILLTFSILGGRILRILCLINRDMKVIIAYSSVVHIAIIIAAIFFKKLLISKRDHNYYSSPWIMFFWNIFLC